MADLKVYPAGDCSLLAEFKNEISPTVNDRVIGLYNSIKAENIDGITDFIPAFCSLLINYNPQKISYKSLKKTVKKLSLQNVNLKAKEAKTFYIPVCYGGIFGEDMQRVEKHTGLRESEIINLHSQKPYRIYMLGFLPGFPYLGGLDKALFTPRLPSPRAKIPGGAVGIGGEQTGIYPLDSPGGWNLIGRTPIKLFDAKREKAILFSAGDFIKFEPVSKEEYIKIEELVKTGSYKIKIGQGGL